MVTSITVMASPFPSFVTLSRCEEFSFVKSWCWIITLLLEVRKFVSSNWYLQLLVLWVLARHGPFSFKSWHHFNYFCQFCPPLAPPCWDTEGEKSLIWGFIRHLLSLIWCSRCLKSGGFWIGIRNCSIPARLVFICFTLKSNHQGA